MEWLKQHALEVIVVFGILTLVALFILNVLNWNLPIK